jgi:ABC-type nickel/cobalt efflux system permease component RcnA
MRTSLKCLIFYLIVGVILLNLYFLGQVYFDGQKNEENEQHQHQHQHHHHHHHSNEFSTVINQQDELVDPAAFNTNNLKTTNEFLILDWTGHQHIFQEQDPIKCKLMLENINTCYHLFLFTYISNRRSQMYFYTLKN